MIRIFIILYGLIYSVTIHISVLNRKSWRWVMTIPHAVIDMIGNPPMLELTLLDTGPCRPCIKLENQNSGCSIKDRVALSMIKQAERAARPIIRTTPNAWQGKSPAHSISGS